MVNDFGAFLVEHVRRVEPLFRDVNLAMWESSTSGSDEAGERMARLQAEIMRVYANREEYERLREWARNPPPNPDVARQLELLRLAYARGQRDDASIERLASIEKDVLAAFVSFRGSLDGKQLSDNELTKLLNGETDSARLRAAWEAQKQIGGAVAEKVLEAVALRNESARRMGFADYYRQSLALGEIDETRLFAILGELERLTDEPFRREKAALDAALADRYGIAVADLRPWHYGDPFFQRPPKVGTVAIDEVFAGRDILDLAARTFDGVGLDARDILARSDLFAREGKDQHAFCIHVDRRGDVRILVNVEPDERWMETTLHELGHGVYDKYLGESLPFILREPAHTLSTEAVAMLFGRLALNEEWLVKVAGLDPASAATIGGPARARQRLGMLIFVRWVLVMVHFERAMYADPTRDLNRLWWDLVERFQLLRRPDGRDAPDWASKVHLALYPAYYQNYMLGELMASQIQSWLKRECGGLVGRPEAGRLLRESLFAPGARAEWDETIERATGERLNPRYFVDEFVVA